MSDDEDKPLLVALNPSYTLVYTSIVTFLIGFSLLTFSTVMVYKPFSLDTFLSFTDMELGFISFLICILSPSILLVDTSGLEDDSYFLRLRFISGTILFATMLLFALTWVVICPIENYYGNSNNGGTYTIEFWLMVSFWVNFGINMIFLAVEKFNEFFAA